MQVENYSSVPLVNKWKELHDSSLFIEHTLFVLFYELIRGFGLLPRRKKPVHP